MAKKYLDNTGLSTFWAKVKAYIDGKSSSGGAYYGTCDTAAGTAAKVVACSNFALETGARISVKFTNDNTVAAATLNVNNTGAIPIVLTGYPNFAQYKWNPGEVVDFVYDGTYYEMVDCGLATTEYYGITKLRDSTSSTSTIEAAVPKSVKAAYDLANGKASVTLSTTDIGEGATLDANTLYGVYE